MSHHTGRTVAKVLLVDDWEAQLNQWTRDCKAAAKIPLRASSRQEALDIARREKPDVVIVDLFLDPPDTGLEVIRDLKAFEPNIYAILVSGHLSVDFAMLAVEAGADDCFSKSVRFNQLIHRAEHGERPVPEPGAVPTLDDVEWDHISRVLNDCSGNITHAAQALGEHRFTLQRKIKRHAPGALRPARIPRRLGTARKRRGPPNVKAK